MKILLTGANGFIGRFLYWELVHRGHTVTCAIRKKYALINSHGNMPGKVYYYETLGRQTDFECALTDVEVVVHLAARAHMPTRTDFDMYNDFLEINFHGTVNLAKQALQKGVKRLVFISSIGVNGKSTPDGYRYTEEDEEQPYNSYTFSKMKAEMELRKLSLKSAMEVVIVRPPLVYGPHVKANFLKLMRLVYTGLPLPFAGINNARSFIFIDNLTEVLALCVTAANAGNQTFIVCDDPPLSTPQLLHKISHTMGKRLRLFCCPPVVAKTVATVLQKEGIYNRLWGNLAVSSKKIQNRLGWKPKISVDDGIWKTASWFCEQKLKNGTCE
jgi:nucleoside-diphosphate-sugar epimerase